MIISLQNYSLVTITPGIETMLVQMHPLVHGWIHSCIPEQDMAKYQSGAVLLLALGAREDYTSSAQYLASHASHLSPLWDKLDVNSAEAFGRILHTGGVFKDAARLRERVVAELRTQASPDRLTLSNSLWVLAMTYRELGLLSEAAGIQEEVLRVRKDVLGERDPGTLSALDGLGGTYHDLGRLKEALELKEDALRLRKEVLGEHHSDTITASSNLARTYRDQGRLEEAALLQEEGLKLRKEILGDCHPDTISASYNLGIVYLNLGRLKEAEVLQEDVLKLRKEILGENHPETLKASNNLAYTYRDLGKLDQAEVMQVETVRRMREVLGDQHPSTTNSMLTLTEISESLHKKAPAFELLELAEAIITEKLGKNHWQYPECQKIRKRMQDPEDLSSPVPMADTPILHTAIDEAPPQHVESKRRINRLRRFIAGLRHRFS